MCVSASWKLLITKKEEPVNCSSLTLLLWVVMDSNHRRHRQQIYSLPHLATLVTTRYFKSVAKVWLYFENKE